MTDRNKADREDVQGDKLLGECSDAQQAQTHSSVGRCLGWVRRRLRG
jgi:hypothetical protein